MSDTILSGDFTIYYSADNNQKRLAWTGSSTGTRTVNEVYSALQSLFDDPSQMDDLVPIKADTPDIYRMQNQWFIDDTSVEHLTGGSLFSSGWKVSTTEHVLIIGYNPTVAEFNAADIGRTILGTTTLDTGTILDFNTTRNLIWIRPVDPLAAGDEFDNGYESYTIQNDAFGQVWNTDGVATTWGNETVDANDVDNADWNIFDTGAATDIAYFGFAQKFSKLIFDNLNGTAGTVGTVTWQYWDGTAWTALAGVTDGTSQFKIAVADGQVLTFTVPTNWATTSVNGSAQLYYIRADVGTAYTQNPIYDQGFVGGVGAGAFVTHGRHGVASKGGESAWTGITTIGTIADNTHLYIAQEDPDRISVETSTIATKGTSDWWDDGHLDLLLKVKEADSVFGNLPASSPATAVATFLARQYTRTYSHFVGTALATAGGNTVVPVSTAIDLDNTLGYRNLVWDNGSSETLVTAELLYNVGTTTAGNLDAGVQDDGGVFTDDTTDVNDVGGAGDVAVFPAVEVANDAFYFGKDNIFTFLMVDVATQGVSSAAATTWEYYNGSTWAALTVVDDSNTGNGSFTAAVGRRLISWTAPSAWARVNVTNQPLTAPTKLYYVRVRISAANYTTVPILETVWCGGEKQLKARIADASITTPAGATGNSDYYLVGDPILDFANNDVAIAGTSRKIIDINGAPTDVGPAADTDITATHGAVLVDVDENGVNEPYSIDINNASLKTVSKMYERFKYLARRGETATASTNGQQGQFYIGDELQVEYDTQSGAFAQGRKVYDQTTDAEGLIVADHDDGATGDLILRIVRGTFTAGNVLSDSPDPTYVMNTNSKCYAVDVSTPSIVDESADALSAGVGDVGIFVGVEEVNIDYFAIGAIKPFAKVIFDNTGGTAGTDGVVLWEYWNGTTWANLETAPGFVDGTTDFKAALGVQNLTFYPPADWETLGLTDGTVNSPTLYFIRARVTTVYTINPLYNTIAVEDNVTANINGTPRTIAQVTGAPFGTYPGASKLFFAPGATPAPAEMATGESQKFQTIDDNGNTKLPPNKQDMIVTNLVSGDTVTTLRIASQGGAVTKNQFLTGAGNSQSNTTLVANGAIGSDNPTSGKVRVVSVGNQEQRYRYASYTSATFTLATGVVAGDSDGGNSSATRLHDTTGTPFTNAEVGDFVRNITEGKIVRITGVISANEINTEAVTNWTGDSYDYNVLMETYASGLNVYVPIIEVIADAASESATIVYGADLDVRVDVRKAGTLLPFSQDTTFVSTGRSIATVRSADDIFA